MKAFCIISMPNNLNTGRIWIKFPGLPRPLIKQECLIVRIGQVIALKNDFLSMYFPWAKGGCFLITTCKAYVHIIRPHWQQTSTAYRHVYVQMIEKRTGDERKAMLCWWKKGKGPVTSVKPFHNIPAEHHPSFNSAFFFYYFNSQLWRTSSDIFSSLFFKKKIAEISVNYIIA